MTHESGAHGWVTKWASQAQGPKLPRAPALHTQSVTKKAAYQRRRIKMMTNRHKKETRRMKTTTKRGKTAANRHF